MTSDRITQADRTAAERFNCDLRCNLTGTQVNNLAGLLAKHRRTEPVAAEPVAWLYEHPLHPSDVEAGVSARLTEHDKSYGWTETPLYAHPPAPDQAQPIDDEALVERIAWSIIDGSAGERAANHACEFCTANWSDALRSARAILPIIRECLK